MTELNIETMEERLNAALSRPSKRGTQMSIGDWMTSVIDYFSSPRHEKLESRRAEHYRAAAGG